MSTVVVKSVDERAVRGAMDAYAAQLLDLHPNINEIVVFGSFEQGTWAPGSDLDVFVVLASRIGPLGLCRDYAVFLTSILRYKGLPARMRVGFAAYLNAGETSASGASFKGDHWITEYWNKAQGRWILADADLGGMPQDAFMGVWACDFTDLRADHDFYVAGSAWRLARAGEISSTYFRYSERWKGFPCIRGNLLHDFQALNKLELRIFDYFVDLHRKPEHQMTVEDKALLDQIAGLSFRPRHPKRNQR